MYTLHDKSHPITDRIDEFTPITLFPEILDEIATHLFSLDSSSLAGKAELSIYDIATFDRARCRSALEEATSSRLALTCRNFYHWFHRARMGSAPGMTVRRRDELLLLTSQRLLPCGELGLQTPLTTRSPRIVEELVMLEIQESMNKYAIQVLQRLDAPNLRFLRLTSDLPYIPLLALPRFTPTFFPRLSQLRGLHLSTVAFESASEFTRFCNQFPGLKQLKCRKVYWTRPATYADIKRSQKQRQRNSSLVAVDMTECPRSLEALMMLIILPCGGFSGAGDAHIAQSLCAAVDGILLGPVQCNAEILDDSTCTSMLTFVLS